VGIIESYTAADTFPTKLIQNKKVIDIHGKIIPYHIQLYPTNVCNLKCEFCSCANRNQKDELSLQDTISVLSDAAELGCKAVTISGGGEPLLHPNINEIIEIINDLGMKVGLTTNGIALSNIKIGNLRKNITWLRISHSDLREWTWDYEIKIAEILKYCGAVDWGFSYVVTDNINFEMLQKIIKFSNKKGAAYVRLVSNLLNLNDVSEMATIKEYLQSHDIDDSIVIYQGRKEFHPGIEKCLISLLKPVINADGYIYPCCLNSNETVIIDDNGILVPKRVNEVKEGDMALGHGKIKKVWKKPPEEILRITLKNNRFIEVSKDHIMVTSSSLDIKSERFKELNDYTLEEKLANTIEIDDLIPVKYQFNDFETSRFDSFIDDDLVWLKGQYVADGCSSDRGDKGYSIELKYGLHATEKLKKLEKVLNKFNYKYKVYKRRTGFQINIYSKLLFNIFKECGGDALNKRIPPSIFNCNNYQKELFLKSYFDGDGHLGKPNKSYKGYRIIFSTISKQLASDLVLLLSTLGIIATISIHKRDKMVIEEREVNCHDLYRVKISGNYNLLKLTMFPEIKYLDVTRRSPKRALGFYKKDGLMFVPVKKIEKIMSDDLFDIQVENTNMFYSSFGILLHNCGVQYARKEPDLSCGDSMAMGPIQDLKKIYQKQKYFNGNQCVKCYYNDYNFVLDKLILKIKHEDFL